MAIGRQPRRFARGLDGRVDVVDHAQAGRRAVDFDVQLLDVLRRKSRRSSIVLFMND